MSLCEICGNWPSVHKHHRKLRSQGGTDGPTMDLCAPCHQYVHDHPKNSYEQGWLIHSWDEATALAEGEQGGARGKLGRSSVAHSDRSRSSTADIFPAAPAVSDQRVSLSASAEVCPTCGRKK